MNNARRDQHYRISAATGVTIARHDDGAILLDETSGRLFALNTTAARIWEGLVANRSMAEVGAEVAADADLPVAQVNQDIERLLADLARVRLLGGDLK